MDRNTYDIWSIVFFDHFLYIKIEHNHWSFDRIERIDPRPLNEVIVAYYYRLNAIPIFVEKDELDEFNSFYCDLYRPIMDNDVSVEALQKMDQTN